MSFPWSTSNYKIGRKNISPSTTCGSILLPEVHVNWTTLPCTTHLSMCFRSDIGFRFHCGSIFPNFYSEKREQYETLRYNSPWTTERKDRWTYCKTESTEIERESYRIFFWIIKEVRDFFLTSYWICLVNEYSP